MAAAMDVSCCIPLRVTLSVLKIIRFAGNAIRRGTSPLFLIGQPRTQNLTREKYSKRRCLLLQLTQQSVSCEILLPDVLRTHQISREYEVLGFDSSRSNLPKTLRVPRVTTFEHITCPLLRPGYSSSGEN